MRGCRRNTRAGDLAVPAFGEAISSGGGSPDAVDQDKRDKVENLQKGVALVTAWIEHDDGGIDLLNDLVHAYAANERGVAPLLEGLVSLATALLIELRAAGPEYGTEQKILQRISAEWAADLDS